MGLDQTLQIYDKNMKLCKDSYFRRFYELMDMIHREQRDVPQDCHEFTLTKSTLYKIKEALPKMLKQLENNNFTDFYEDDILPFDTEFFINHLKELKEFVEVYDSIDNPKMVVYSESY